MMNSKIMRDVAFHMGGDSIRIHVKNWNVFCIVGLCQGLLHISVPDGSCKYKRIQRWKHVRHICGLTHSAMHKIVYRAHWIVRMPNTCVIQSRIHTEL